MYIISLYSIRNLLYMVKEQVDLLYFLFLTQYKTNLTNFWLLNEYKKNELTALYHLTSVVVCNVHIHNVISFFVSFVLPICCLLSYSYAIVE
jgi:hypothetical protein